MEISIVVPVLNEEENVKQLFDEISQVVSKLKKTYEIIFVDDGSWDNTFKALNSINDKHLKIIKLRNNFGQSAALDAGFKNASGNIIIAMDGDLQNDPNDIPALLNKLNEGYDVVSGWRADRKDPITKKIPSKIAYLIRKRITKLKIHDSGCTLKAYRKEALDGLDLYGEMHRFIPDLIALKGFKITEVKVNHRPRLKGKTKYKFTRMLKGFLDLAVVYFWKKFAKRPIHFFGGIGTLFILSGGIIDAYLLFGRLFLDQSLADRPLFILANFILIMGIQLFVTGLLADISMKNHYKITKEMNYSIEKIVKK
ncbi:glycosyltransferase family 2 protein [Candidatus Woesearchaeota archaeon]|nr:glycosyltransferase family 2 protein [Candidatus Woesearchaeota archaeon]